MGVFKLELPTLDKWTQKLYDYKSQFPKRSWGELEVKVLLEKHRIEFLEEVNLVLNNRDTGETRNVRIDFYIPKIKMFIEYNGRQHYEPVYDFGGITAFEKQQERDMWVRNACNTNDHRLLEIPYYACVETSLKEVIELYNA